MSTLRIALIGCGKIADQHVQSIQRIPGCEIVATCDREVLMARQLAERFAVPHVHEDASRMLAEVKPDVVHITTPPQGHFPLALQCLQAGAHVYLEKPFTVTAAEAEKLIETAQSVNRIIVAGHNYQFTPEMCAMRQRVREGFLGGKAVHVESYYPYDLGDATYVGPLLGSKKHWVRQLPGQLLHNLISHGTAKLAEFLDDEIVELRAQAHESAKMLSFGGRGIFDELRVTLRDKNGATAYFCFSSSIKPAVNQLRVFGPVNSLIVDQGCCSLIRTPAKTGKSYLVYFIPPFHYAREYFRNARHNVMAFLGRRLYQDFGMTELIRQFYRSIRENQQPPIPYREILLTARIMDSIFAQIYPPENTSSADATNAPRP